MTFRPNKERFILLLAIIAVALIILFIQANSLPAFFANSAPIVLISGVALFWLSRFEIRFEGSQIFYQSLFGGKVQFQEAQIESILPNKFRSLIDLLYTKQTLFITLKTGQQVKINTRVFPAEVAEIMKKLTLRLQAHDRHEPTSQPS